MTSLQDSEVGVAEPSSRTSAMLKPEATLRFAVFCTDLDWMPWQAQTVQQLQARSCQLVRVVRLVTPRTTGVPAPAGRHDALSLADTGKGLAKISVECVDDGEGGWQLAAEGVAAIRALSLDFILAIGIERVRGDVLNAARHGVWVFAGFGPNAKSYAGPAFWPVFTDENLTTAALMRLDPVIGHDAVLKRGTLRTKRTYRTNYDQLVNVMSEWPAAVASMLRTGCPLHSERFSAAEWAAAVATPSWTQRWSLATRYALRLLRRLAGIAFCLDVWHIGVAHCDMRQVRDAGLPEDIDWAPKPGLGIFYADPMALETTAGTKVFFEYFSYWGGKGDIRTLHYSRGEGWSRHAKPFITEPFHLSYPTIVEFGDGTFCLPESTMAGASYLYPLASDGALNGHKRKFTDFEVADPALIEHEGRWYLFGGAAAEARYNLRIWYSDSPTGPWTPHPANPVKCDVQTVRLAGPIVRLDGRLYRPSQNSTKSYGSSANLMEIVELSPTAFREVTARAIDPDDRWPYPHGIHTVSPTRDGVLIDAKIVRITPLGGILRTINSIRVRRLKRMLARRVKPACER